MRRPSLTTVLCLCFIAAFAAAAVAQSAENAGPKLPSLLPRDREIALALSAGPAHLAEGAGVYVLERSGYVKVRGSKNGFTCLVERSLPTSLEPECYDAEGSEIFVPRVLREAELRAQGKSAAEVRAEVNEGFSSGKFRAPRRPGIIYMLSTENRVPVNEETGEVAPYGPHLMFYAPYLTNKDIGSRMGAGDHVFIISEGSPRALMIVPVPAAQPGDAHH